MNFVISSCCGTVHGDDRGFSFYGGCSTSNCHRQFCRYHVIPERQALHYADPETIAEIKQK